MDDMSKILDMYEYRDMCFLTMWLIWHVCKMDDMSDL
jgi:hypothetical protein